MTDAILVFTGKSRSKIFAEGGTSSWTLNRKVAAKIEYVVCTRNSHWDNAAEQTPEPHHSGFLVGRVSGIVPSPSNPDRWLIKFDAYADLAKPNLWPSLRNPVHYTTLEALGVDVGQLKFEPMPEAETFEPVRTVSVPNARRAGLSIAAAKPLLATHYNVTLEQIEITIRG